MGGEMDLYIGGPAREEVKVNDKEELLHGLGVGAGVASGLVGETGGDMVVESAGIVQEQVLDQDALGPRKRSSSEHLLRHQDPQDDQGTRKRSLSAADLFDAVDSSKVNVVFSARCKIVAGKSIRKIEEKQILTKQSVEVNEKKIKEINSCLSYTHRKVSIMDAKVQQVINSQEIQDRRKKTAGKVWKNKNIPEHWSKLRIVMYQKICTDLASKEESRLTFIKDVFGRVGKRIGKNNPLYPKKKRWFQELFNEIKRTAPEVHISVYASADNTNCYFPFNAQFYSKVIFLMRKFTVNHFDGEAAGFDNGLTVNTAFYQKEMVKHLMLIPKICSSKHF